MPTRAYIGLGSNLNTPARQIRSAIKAIAKLPFTRLVCTANWYKSAPVGPGHQANYINTAVAIDTTLKPRALLKALQGIEAQQGRKRIVHWGPRTLDLDILIFGTLTLKTKTLCIPHPRIADRSFVLYPLYDIAPALLLPNKRSLKTLLENCPSDGTVPIKTKKRQHLSSR